MVTNFRANILEKRWVGGRRFGHKTSNNTLHDIGDQYFRGHTILHLMTHVS